MTSLTELINSQSAALFDGSKLEKLRREQAKMLDKHVAYSAMIYDDHARRILASLYRDYFEIASRYQLPILSLTPTWKADFERIAHSSFRDRPINRDCVEFVREVEGEFLNSCPNIFIGGQIGCKGNAYDPSTALDIETAYDFHSHQISELADSGIDFLIASTMSSRTESEGIARAMATTHLPYVISYVIDGEGYLLDGTPLAEALDRLETLEMAPLFYSLNCVHPSIAGRGLRALREHRPDLASRVIGLRGNTSSKPARELDNAAKLQTQDPETFALEMRKLNSEFDVRILGGCCGTGPEHIDKIAQFLSVSSLKGGKR